MKKLLFLIVVTGTLASFTACSSSTRIGTRHHHVTVGTSAQ